MKLTKRFATIGYRPFYDTCMIKEAREIDKAVARLTHRPRLEVGKPEAVHAPSIHNE